MENLTITTILTLILAATPLSLFLMSIYNKLAARTHVYGPDIKTICTNIVGTLTEKELKLKTLYFDNYKASVREQGLINLENTQRGENLLIQKKQMQKDNSIEWIATISALCHYQKLKTIEDATIGFLRECQFNMEKYHRHFEIIQKLPFNADKKITTVVAIRDNQDIFALSKGKPIKILNKCDRINIDNEKLELSTKRRRKIRKIIKKLDQNGQKAIAFAYKALPKKRQDKYEESFAEDGLVFAGIIGLTNPLNTEIQENIDLAKEAGIKIYTITKSKEKKAESIAKKLGLINPQYFETITGKYLSSIPDHKLTKILSNREKDFIFAEVNDEQKLRISKVLTEMDIESIHTDKETPNSFNLIVDGIKKARIIHINKQKVSLHAISCKIAEFSLVLVAILLGAPLPLTIAMIIILDLFINFTLELGLRVEPLDKKVMSKDFCTRKNCLKKKKFRLITNSIFITLILISVYIWDLFRNGWTLGEEIGLSSSSFARSTTIIFFLLAIIQILNAFNLRSLHKSFFTLGFFRNFYILLSTIIGALVLYALTNIPYLQNTLSLSPLSTIEWQIILLTSVILVVLEEIRKLFINQEHVPTN